MAWHVPIYWQKSYDINLHKIKAFDKWYHKPSIARTSQRDGNPSIQSYSEGEQFFTVFLFDEDPEHNSVVKQNLTLLSLH